jgi:hypothetical protein
MSRAALRQDAAIRDEHYAVAESLDVVHVVGGQDDRNAAFAVEAPDKVPKGELGHGVQADGGLVQEQDRGGVEQGGRQVAAHALAQAELPHWHVQQRFKVQHRDQLVPRTGVAGRRNTVDVAKKLEGLDDREVPPELGALAEDDADVTHVGDPLLPGRPSEDLAPAGVRY